MRRPRLRRLRITVTPDFNGPAIATEMLANPNRTSSRVIGAGCVLSQIGGPLSPESLILDPESLTSGVLRYDDVRKLRGHVLCGLRDLDGEPARDRPVDLRRPAVGIGDHGRLARVSVLADIDVERQGPEQLGAVLPAHTLGAALPEDVLLVTAVRADVRAHVLDDAEDGNADFLEHLEALAGVDERDVLGRGDDHGARHRHLLGERELDVAGAWRHVDDEVVDIAPARVLEQLLEGLRHHRPAPHHRGIDVDEKADRDRLDAVARHRLERLAVLGLGPSGDAEHRRLRWAVDIGIEHADARPFRGERKGQVHCRGRLAHPALARGHGDDVLHRRNQLDAALYRVRNDLARDPDGDAAYPGDPSKLSGDELADRVELGFPRIAELDVEGNVCAFHPDVLRRLGGVEILAGVRVEDLLEGAVNLFLCDRHGGAAQPLHGTSGWQ